jgi:hypothetical protein
VTWNSSVLWRGCTPRWNETEARARWLPKPTREQLIENV